MDLDAREKTFDGGWLWCWWVWIAESSSVASTDSFFLVEYFYWTVMWRNGIKIKPLNYYRFPRFFLHENFSLLFRHRSTVMNCMNHQKNALLCPLKALHINQIKYFHRFCGCFISNFDRRERREGRKSLICHENLHSNYWKNNCFIAFFWC